MNQWTPERNARLQTLRKAGANADTIAVELGASGYAVRCQLRALGFAQDMRRKLAAEDEEPDHAAMDGAFCRALALAIAKGLEHATAGIIATPCTQRAVVMRPMSPALSQSVAAQCVEHGDDSRESLRL